MAGQAIVRQNIASCGSTSAARAATYLRSGFDANAAKQNATWHKPPNFRTAPSVIATESRPWLGQYTKEPCGEPNRLLIRTASNSYFPQKMTVISLPDRDETVKQAIDAAWEFLEAVEDIDQLRYERKKAKVKAALDGVTDDEAFAEVQVRRGGGIKQEKKVKVAELETLVASKEELGDDRPNGNFFARTLARPVWDRPWMRDIDRIVLVHRLREVVAQVGFTRFEAAAPDIEGELEMGVRRASLAREISWLPAVENKGEGIFIQFKTEAITQWLNKPAVQERGRQLDAGFTRWQTRASRHAPHLSGASVPDAALVFPHAYHGCCLGMWLSGKFDPRANLRPAWSWLWRAALHRNFRRGRHARRADSSRPTNPRTHP